MGPSVRGKQYGVGTKDGCTLMAASIEAFMESNPGSIDIAGDTMNAFNSFDRSELWPTLLAKFPNLVAYIVLTYGDAAPVFFKEGETLTTILNSVGSRQGCALGSYLFAIALHPILQTVAAEFPTVLVSAYCDDAHFTGPPADAVAAFRRYAQLTSAKLQNKLRPDKSEVYSPTVSESALRAAGLPAEFVSSKIHSDGMRVLGVPVGTTEYKARFCHQVVKALAADLATLRRVPSLQAQHVILTKSLMHRVTNLLRAIPGNSLAFKDAAELYDSELTKFAQSYVPWISLPQHSRKLAFMPLGHGGLGLRSWRDHADAAFVASYVQMSRVIPAHYPLLAPSFPELLSFAERCDPAVSERTYEAAMSWSRLRSTTPRVRDALESDSVRHLQHKLSEHLDEARRLDLLGDIIRIDRDRDPDHPRHQAMFFSHHEPHALAAIPSDAITTYSNRVFAVIVARRLLLPTQQPLGDSESLQCQYCHKTTHGMGCRCRYDAPDIYGDHAFSCARGRGERGKWHDGLRDVWMMLGSMAGASISKEVSGFLPSSNMRADLVISDSLTSSTTLFDVRTCDPTKHNSSENICRESAAVPGASAEHEAAGKNKKWRASCQQMGLRFVSLCHESGGRMSQATTTFLDSLVHRSGGSTSDQARFRTFASQRLACANASGMAKLILSFNNHIRRSDGAVVRSARDVRLPQVPEAPIGSHRQRLAPTRAAVSPVEDFERDSAERNTTFIAHTSPVHQDPLENWRDGTASALGHVPELGRTPE